MKFASAIVALSLVSSAAFASAKKGEKCFDPAGKEVATAKKKEECQAPNTWGKSAAHGKKADEAVTHSQETAAPATEAPKK